MPALTDYELRVLAAITSDKDISEFGLTFGAALNASLEFLRDSGYITQYIGTIPELTEKGKLELEKQPPSAA